MTKRIQLLSDEVINKIAAGEVIERPASVVKELVENSIDANSTEIEVHIDNGGKDLIQVIDNGQGMVRDDARLALERHATSKITEANDLFSIRTLGFRGEALPSIAAVSRMEIKTRTKEELGGTILKVEGGQIKQVKDIGCSVGTNIIVKDLFYNTPVRYKYLKTAATEISRISDIINRLALAYPEISFKLTHNQKKILESPGNDNLLDCILSIYGREIAKSMIKVNYEDKYMKISGYVSKPNINRASRKHQSFFINRRYIKSKVLSEAIGEAYHTLLAKGRHQIVILTIKLNPILIDVNVHPTKMEVNFSREKEVYNVVKDGVKEALQNTDLAPQVKLNARKGSEQFNKNKTKKTNKESKKRQSSKEKLSNKRQPKDEQQRLNLTTGEKATNRRNKTNKSLSRKKEETKSNQQIKIQPKEAKKESKQNDNKDHIEEERKEQVRDKITQEKNDKEHNNHNKNINIREESEEYDAVPTLFPLGQVHKTYIVAQDEDGFYIIDQHAAHERILYNQILENFESTTVQSQPLLIPLQLELTRPEIEILKEHQDNLEKLGFDIEHFGGQTYLVRAVPYLLHQLNTKEVTLDIIDNLLEKGSVKEPTKIIEDLIILISCRSAIKSGDKLVPGEMEELLKKLERTENKYTCPHGRPTIIHFSQSELAKKFKRN
ncbi:DNA mismatch repair protein MutL [Candidatus Frackibacter sp. WG11]|uniref:DNA mismatch repair endonuclease MutL n=1 Tax=Candidatus Frackibacter sp. WG11 TaxID=2017976 RepID=UPI00088A6DE6|nr:DNA mismatch repair endonuclease MutL [Candidatus Frackibacter sp. WG11]SDC26873.1 DNA mismatch repair protein MutL [Candidatus Frackibacter sp. WG11]